MIFKFRGRLLGGHVHCRVFAGENPDALGKSGDLVFRPDEWEALRAVAALVEEAEMDHWQRPIEHLMLIVVDDDEEPARYDLPLDGPQFVG